MLLTLIFIASYPSNASMKCYPSLPEYSIGGRAAVHVKKIVVCDTSVSEPRSVIHTLVEPYYSSYVVFLNNEVVL